MVCTSDPEPTNVILLCDDACMIGLYATINSIVSNCKTPEHLHFYVGLDTKDDVISVEYALMALFGSAVRDITVVDVRSVSHLVEWYGQISKLLTIQRTANIMNYARFFVSDMFPQLAANPKNSYIYMDVDKIVYGDVRAHDLELRSKYGHCGTEGTDSGGQFMVVGLDESRTVGKLFQRLFNVPCSRAARIILFTSQKPSPPGSTIHISPCPCPPGESQSFVLVPPWPRLGTA